MKIKTLAFVVTSALALSSTAALAASTANGGTVHFTGEITNGTCAVSANSGNQTVKLGQAKATSLAAAGKVSNQTAFNIDLIDCDTTVAATAAVAFSGPATAAGDALSVSSITTPGVAATNVGIQILDQNNAVIKPNSGVPGAAKNIDNSTVTLPFTAQFISYGSATAGAADADAQFTVYYN
ncbi:fimbrial protein [Klebsiella sp. CTHL.F3a]|uniref:fimbrial protein n=1 Tax=Klebsiella sp. CTHL.F3a TaxID=2873296 RepID=UPI001CA7936F|nr:fimbrial protein [Klebsiella sp. CTHL.F3a]QZY80909.1 fimbrial protein [Klebsiella sp. CTHL.F3a]